MYTHWQQHTNEGSMKVFVYSMRRGIVKIKACQPSIPLGVTKVLESRPGSRPEDFLNGKNAVLDQKTSILSKGK